MDDEQWDREKEVQNDYLRSQIEGLLKLPPARRRRYQLLLVICQKCGHPLLEVLDTIPYPVVRLRRLQGRTGHSEFLAKRREGGADWKDFFAASPVSLHLDDWSFIPIPQPSAVLELEARGDLVQCGCRCGTQTLTMPWIIRQIRSGGGKVVLPRPGHARS